MNELEDFSVNYSVGINPKQGLVPLMGVVFIAYANTAMKG